MTNINGEEEIILVTVNFYERCIVEVCTFENPTRPIVQVCTFDNRALLYRCAPVKTAHYCTGVNL
jgi:hypothetical protein